MNSKPVKSEINKGKNKVKKKAKAALGTGVLLIWAAVLLLGVGAGFGAGFLVTANDTFELRYKKVATVPANKGIYVFKDPGARVIEFGRDISDKVTAKSDLEKDAEGNYLIDTSEEGSFYIVYTVDSLRFGKVKRVRTITVVGED